MSPDRLEYLARTLHAEHSRRPWSPTARRRRRRRELLWAGAGLLAIVALFAVALALYLH